MRKTRRGPMVVSLFINYKFHLINIDNAYVIVPISIVDEITDFNLLGHKKEILI